MRFCSDREVSSSAAATGQSAAAEAAMSTASLRNEVQSKGRDISCDSGNPIVVAMDVTSSRGNDAKILYDKLPMFFGQLLMQEYVEDCALSFAAIGDATDADQAPIQICDFAQGSELDNWLKKLWLEEGGGGSGQESYELTAFYYAHHCALDCNTSGQKGFFFITGDEGFYPMVKKDQVQRLIGDPVECDIPSAQEFARLQEKFEVFFCFPRKSMEEKIENIDKEINKRLAREGGCAEGAIVFTLTWDVNCDLDLHVNTPAGAHIFYSSKTAGGQGRLDVDMTSSSKQNPAVENIFFQGSPDLGNYTVWVHNYNGSPTTPYTLRVKIHDETYMITGEACNQKHTYEYKGELYHTSPELKAAAEQRLKDKYAAYNDEVILEQWERVLSRERILDVGDPKAIVDIMLGTVAIMNGKRDLDAYVKDLESRGQDEIRIHHVVRALAELDAAKKGGFMNGASRGEAYDLAFELAEAKKQIATMKAEELIAKLPPPSVEAQLEEDLIRIASESSATPDPAPAVYRSS
jgi:uncharacterized protein YfaP (DUF2135 family)